VSDNPFADLYPNERPKQPPRPTNRGSVAAQTMAGPELGEQQVGINPRAPQASAQAASSQDNPFSDLMPSPSAQSAPGEPAPYKDRRQALDDAVNYLDEGRDINEVAAGFQAAGITRDEIIQHAQKRGAASAQPQQMQPAAPQQQRMGITATGTNTIQPTQDSAAARTAGVIVRGYEQAKQVGIIAAREIRAINDATAAKALGKSMAATQGGRFAQPVDVQQTMTELGQAETFGEGLGVIAKNPLKFVEGIAESVVASLPQMAGTVAAGFAAGPVGMAGAAGTMSMATEYASAIAEAVTQAGGDPTDPAAIERAFQDPELMAAARAKGAQRGLVIGTFDALTAGVAGKFVQAAQAAQKEAAKAGVKAGAKGSMGIAAAKEAGVQSGGALAGEMGAQATQGEYKPGEGLAEVAADVPGSAVEIATGAREDVRRSKQPVKAGSLGIQGQTAGTQGSVGAAGTDKALERRTRAASLPVPVKLSEGQATGEFGQQRFENETAAEEEAGVEIRRFRNEQNNAVDANFAAMVEQTGAKEQSAEGGGRVLIDVLSERRDRKLGEIRKKYEEARAAGETEEMLDTSGIVDTLNSIRSSETNAGVIKTAADELVRLGGAVRDEDGTLIPGQISLNDLEEIRKTIGVGGKKDATNSAFASQIRTQIDAATETAAGDIYREARGLYRKYAEEFNDQGVIKQLVNLKKNSSDRIVALENVYRRITTGGTLQDMRNIKRSLEQEGDKGKQAWAEMQALALDKLREATFGNQGRNEERKAIATANGLSKAIKALDSKGQLDELFGKPGAQTLRDLSEVVSDAFTKTSETFNTSGSGRYIKQMMLDAAASYLSGQILPLTTIAKAVKTWRDQRKTKRLVAKSLKQDESLFSKAPGSQQNTFEAALRSQATQATPAPAKASSGPPKAAPVPAGKATELDDRTARRLLPTKKERELFRLMEEATDPVVKKELQRQIDADRTQRDRQARGEEFLQLADSATDPEVRASLEAKAKALGVQRKIPAGDVADVETVEATSLADIEAAWVKQEGVNAAELKRANDVIEAFLIDPEATTRATAQFASQPTAYDRAIRSIIEKGKANAPAVETIVPESNEAQGDEGRVQREAEDGSGDQQGTPKFSERGAEATAQAARPERLIELRKQLAVLNKLKACLS